MNFTPRLGISATVRGLIDRMAILRPDITFLICPESGLELSFRQLQSDVHNLAVEFRELGLSKSDKVAFLLDNSVSSAELFLGAMYCGFVAAPVNVRAGVSQISYMLEHSDAKIVYVQEKYRDLLDQAAKNIRKRISKLFMSIPTNPCRSERGASICRISSRLSSPTILRCSCTVPGQPGNRRGRSIPTSPFWLTEGIQSSPMSSHRKIVPSLFSPFTTSTPSA